MKYIKFLLFVLIIVLAGIVYFKYFDNNKPIEKPKVEYKIEKYNYELLSNKSTLYRDKFKELKEVLGSDIVDEETYASLISQLFIIDFYSLEDKTSNIDIGGVQFLHSSISDNFKLKAKDTIYKYVKNNIYGDRNQKLPVVTNVEVKSTNTKAFKSKELSDSSAYYIDVSIEYKEDLGYDKEKSLVVIHESNKLSIISID